MAENLENKICRVCMEKDQEFLPIFELYVHLEVTISLPDLLLEYASVQVTEGDQLPELICNKCVHTIIYFHSLMQKCRQTDEILRIKRDAETTEKKSSNAYEPVKEETVETIKTDETVETVEHTFDDPLQILEMGNVGDTAPIEDDNKIPLKIIKKAPSDDDNSNLETLKELFQMSGYVRCAYCNFVSTNVEMYSDHTAKHDRKFVCELCYRQFQKSSHLNRHMIIHNRESIKKTDEKIKQKRAEKITISSDTGEDLLELGIQIECPTCSFMSTSKEMHKTHMERNHKRKNTCQFCNKKFLKISHFKRHLKIHGKQKKNESNNKDPIDAIVKEESETLITTPEPNASDVVVVGGEFQCGKCEFNTNLEADYKNHVFTHNNNRKYVCLYCNKRFLKPYHIKRHMAVHKGEKLEKEHIDCKECGQVFLSEEQYKQHESTHTGVKHKSHVCVVCQKRFAQLCTLKDHVRTHSGEKPFLCSICGKGFNHLGNLRQHTAIHKGIKSHICSFCNKAFLTKGGLCTHIRMHTGVRPFVCSICEKGFTTSSSMRKHERIHSGEKPYECDICNQRFARSGILIRHKRIHTGEKPYPCPHCLKAFAQSNDLTSHLRIHTGERPYVCDLCGATFRQSSALKTHGKVHLKVEEVI